ncbi:MAG: tRNA pseudouridine(38-40) synthase TruA [Pseudomonadota bacterium]|nr:tRNA pseudouridine(38-40) synthase TruA [Pseudomonadota bacterium]
MEEPSAPTAAPAARTTWRLVIEYDGRAFSGFQRQAGPRTIQETLEAALSKFFGGERIIVHGSGRTDAGVHALGQVISFRAQTPRDAHKVRLALNTMLPPDLACIEAAVAPDRFHARMSARGKTYRYVVLARPDRSPFHVGRGWYVRQPIDWEQVRATLDVLRGTHDFTAFRASTCNNPKTVRTIERAEHLVRGQEHHLEFEGGGFLRYQVRIMVGTAIEVGLGRRSLDDVRAALATGKRALAGRTAPPDGLYLVEVRYPAEAMRLDVLPGEREAALEGERLVSGSDAEEPDDED